MENKFLKIKTLEMEGRKYFYAERLGVDSVAFILYDGKTGLYGLVREFKPPINDFLITAFGGSLDKDKTLNEIVREEVEEEAGYTGEMVIRQMGRAFVSTQMNQYCNLFLVDITKATKCQAKPDEWEKMAEVKWLKKLQIRDTDCWKAITIITRSEPR